MGRLAWVACLGGKEARRGAEEVGPVRMVVVAVSVSVWVDCKTQTRPCAKCIVGREKEDLVLGDDDALFCFVLLVCV